MSDEGWKTWLWGRPEGVRQTLWAQITGRFDPQAVLERARARREGPASEVSGEGWVSLIDWDALPDPGVEEAMWQGTPLAVARRGDDVWVLDGTCPHAEGPLGEGSLRGDALVCPYHGWRFRLSDGACVLGGEGQVQTWPAERRGDRVWAKLA